MSSEPSLVDELWESLMDVVIGAAVGLWWLMRRPWLLGAALIAAGVIIVGGWTAGALVLCVVLLVLVGLRVLRPDWFRRLVSKPWHAGSAMGGPGPRSRPGPG